ncbi:hypothetical protein LH435_08575 [Laribacter hongkongensis]|uniref:hypothetical protein n=1 Tax=Laribacter hongkongensis TaxID=168471 RepID=UPI001EFE6CAE|nr:hypothetical protein [Laribacter hongkongensis]MCG8994100.1 hypothetical protein [Laribacter hongkongensis]MCG9011015.1 hypothetical protein [Laribacter hongkongensis]MCG9021536.1 hypothetical protein [Laribacter hongkongensis]MCG9045849.1 hypothetical protein [Laribacter hongkongensis]MCG9074062.1 hypothetical protein [Laribacter hongkongensis]
MIIAPYIKKDQKFVETKGPSNSHQTTRRIVTCICFVQQGIPYGHAGSATDAMMPLARHQPVWPNKKTVFVYSANKTHRMHASFETY